WDLKRTAAMLTGMGPQLASAPIGRVVNTHADGDHWFGNQLTGCREIISTRAAARAMGRHGPGMMSSLRKVSGLYRLISHAPLRDRDDWRIAADYLDAMMRPVDFRQIKPQRPTNTFSGKLPVEVG